MATPPTIIPEVREHFKDSQATPSPVRQSVDLITPCFYNDAMFRWTFYSNDDDTFHHKLWVFLRSIVGTPVEAGGIVLDAGNWGAAMIVACPGQDFDGVDPFFKSDSVAATFHYGLRPTTRIFFQYLTQVNSVKGRAMPGRDMKDCYYIVITATSPSQRRQGLMPAMMNHVQDLARRDGKPIWLEATSSYSRRQFERLGFDFVDIIHLGKGKVDVNGRRCSGGEGVTISGMIWWPEELRKKTEGGVHDE